MAGYCLPLYRKGDSHYAGRLSPAPFLCGACERFVKPAGFKCFQFFTAYIALRVHFLPAAKSAGVLDKAGRFIFGDDDGSDGRDCFRDEEDSLHFGFWSELKALPSQPAA